MSRIDDMARARRRQFRVFTAFIIAMQVLMVVAAIWLLTHPEKIGSFVGRMIAGAERSAAE